ncbi:MAG: ABC transporter ATP-binding protein [Gammaproteobacteria bacterium]|nr:ABC transporter ATP-binding protein [Gammaproteobacteria bacterium]
MLNIQNIVHQYERADQVALNDINLTIGAGEIFGLLGPNGAGKTTLLSLLASILRVQQGAILLDGIALQMANKQQPRRIAIVPQQYAFYPMLTCYENLAFFAGVCALGKHATTRIDYCINFAQLQHVLKKPAEHLSGGLKRRLNLAIGLIGDPDYLLLDEPTVGIDPQSRSFILDATRELKASGKTVIYSSHYMEEIEYLCDRIAIIDHGQVICEGELSTLLKRSAATVQVTFSQAPAELIRARLTQEFNLAPLTPALYTGSITDPADLSHLLEKLQQLGLIVQSLQYGHQSLESLFMQFTQRSLRD